MTGNDFLTALVNRIRAGDGKALDELVASFEGEVRAAIRHVLGPRNKLGRILGVSDILQSILMRLHRAAGEASGEATPVEDGAAYLGAMVRNRVVHQGRKLATQKRDPDRVSYGEEALDAVADPSPTPASAVMQQELLEAVWKALSPTERDIAEKRLAGSTWEEIAVAGGIREKADTIRRRFQRTVGLVENRFLGG
jgi:RNA polymerase sigma factor (sigma-70 family)